MRWHITLIVIGFELGCGIIAIFIGYSLKIPALSRIYWSYKDIALGSLSAIPLVLFFLLLIKFPLKAFSKIRTVLLELVEFLGNSYIGFILISLMAGFNEELLFRGVIQRVLIDYVGELIGLLITSLLFGICHMVTFTYVVISTLMSFYLGWLFIYSNNLIVPIITHFLYDFIALCILTKRQKNNAMNNNKTL